MRLQRAFTLMELLVVLLIIGILSTVALRTIDATRDRGLFDQTAKELNELVQAMTGNPALSYDGRRVDFGFYGDMGRLPNDPRELVTNTTGDTNWHGPYIRRGLAGDSLGYLYDAWGDVYTYSSGTISSLGNGKYPMTVSVADSMQLRHNTISGTVTDRDNSPPADTTMRIALYTSSDTGNAQVHVSTSGSYTIRRNPMPEGLGSRCAICGKRIVEERVVVHKAAFSSGADVADQGRIELCEIHRDSLTNAKPDEFEEIRRAGAT